MSFALLVGCFQFWECKENKSGKFGNVVYPGVYYADYSILDLHKDSSFIWIRTDSLGDTVKTSLGTYSIGKIETHAFKKKTVYGLTFHVDSVITAEKTQKTSYPYVSIILDDVQVVDSCFTIGFEEYDDFCDYVITGVDQFCSDAFRRNSSAIFRKTLSLENAARLEWEF